MNTRNRQRIVLLMTASIGALAVAAASASAAQGSTSVTVHPRSASSHTADPFAGRVIASGRAVRTGTAAAFGVAPGSRAAGTGVRPAEATGPGGTVIECSVVADEPVVVPVNTPFGGQTKPFNSIGGATFASCTSNVTSITLSPALSFDGGTPEFGPTVRTAGTNEAAGAVLSFCSAGDWQTGAGAVIKMPTGFTPSVLPLSDTSADQLFTLDDCTIGIG